jgi:hypothetical protein
MSPVMLTVADPKNTPLGIAYKPATDPGTKPLALTFTPCPGITATVEETLFPAIAGPFNVTDALPTCTLDPFETDPRTGAGACWT